MAAKCYNSWDTNFTKPSKNFLFNKDRSPLGFIRRTLCTPHEFELWQVWASLLRALDFGPWPKKNVIMRFPQTWTIFFVVIILCKCLNNNNSKCCGLKKSVVGFKNSWNVTSNYLWPRHVHLFLRACFFICARNRHK